MAVKRREFLVNSLAVGTMSLAIIAPSRTCGGLSFFRTPRSSFAQQHATGSSIVAKGKTMKSRTVAIVAGLRLLATLPSSEYE